MAWSGREQQKGEDAAESFNGGRFEHVRKALSGNNKSVDNSDKGVESR